MSWFQFRKRQTQKQEPVFTPHVDIIESPDSLALYADMPGVETKDLDIRVHEGELAIAGTVRQRNEPAKWLVKEYEIGSFYRSFQISDDIDATAISAELKKRRTASSPAKGRAS